MATAIEFNNISKLYRLGQVSTGTIAHDLKRWWTVNVRGQEDPYLKIGETNDRSVKGESDYVWALKDIDFKVEQGDVVGIIGKNGAGKSTLLKILSKVTAPTTGTIRAKGRIGSLLEVGTGFHPEMTGRENIYLNGAILGMTKQEIAKKLDEIVDFSGCERYIDTPVKRYSSGMMVRLGFAVAAHLDPEILVVDEVLAVGDAEFQKKAIGKMQDVSRGEGRTVLFVSHNMTAVKNLCNRGIVLNNGTVRFDGEIEKAINYYLEWKEFESKEIKTHIAQIVPYITIDQVSFNNSTVDKTDLAPGQQFLEISLSGETSMELFAELSFNISSMDGMVVASYDEGHFESKVEKIEVGRFQITRKAKLPKYLFQGNYLVNVFLHQPGVTSYVTIPNGIYMHVTGSAGEFGRVLEARYNGFMGLETYQK